MLIKILSWKNGTEKILKEVKQKDILVVKCDICQKKFELKFKATRDYLTRQLCKKCKTSDTSVKIYGVKHYLKSKSVIQKRETTCQEKYGVKNFTQTDWYKENTPSKSEEVISKILATKRKNQSFNASKPEEIVFDLLNKKFGVERQYSDSRYPFLCDFYIPKIDLFIECHFNWTHGKKPFDENSFEDMQKIKLWAAKSDSHPFYKQAIRVWTQYDVKKRTIAHFNNLKYLEFFNLRGIESWLKTNA